MRVADLMTPKVFTLLAEKKLFVAQQVMDWAHIRHIPVVDDHGRLVGLVSHRDILRASISALYSSISKMERSQHLAGIAVRDVMQTRVHTATPDTTVQEAAKVMRHEKVGCLPVVNAERKLLGIITEHDLLELVEGLPSIG